jgi:hypothetical protein
MVGDDVSIPIVYEARTGAFRPEGALAASNADVDHRGVRLLVDGLQLLLQGGDGLPGSGGQGHRQRRGDPPGGRDGSRTGGTGRWSGRSHPLTGDQQAHKAEADPSKPFRKPHPVLLSDGDHADVFRRDLEKSVEGMRRAHPLRGGIDARALQAERPGIPKRGREKPVPPGAGVGVAGPFGAHHHPPRPRKPQKPRKPHHPAPGPQ